MGLYVACRVCDQVAIRRGRPLIAVIGHARGRTVIVRQRGRGGAAVRIEVGSGSDDSDDQSGPGRGRRCPTANPVMCPY
jgi:hypothetical protein